MYERMCPRQRFPIKFHRLLRQRHRINPFFSRSFCTAAFSALPLVLVLQCKMKAAVYFSWFLCAFLLSGRSQVHADGFQLKKHWQASVAVPVGHFGPATRAEIKSSQSRQLTPDLDTIIAVEDDDDEEQELVGKQAFIAKPHMEVETLCALPPPVNTSLKNLVPAGLSSLLCPCRYLAHRALLI